MEAWGGDMAGCDWLSRRRDLWDGAKWQEVARAALKTRRRWLEDKGEAWAPKMAREGV